MNDNVVNAWLSVQDSVYQLDEALIGPSIDILSSNDGCVYLAPSTVEQLADPTLQFKLLVALTEQLGYHFAKVCTMAGDCRNQEASQFG